MEAASHKRLTESIVRRVLLLFFRVRSHLHLFSCMLQLRWIRSRVSLTKARTIIRALGVVGTAPVSQIVAVHSMAFPML